ncbi:uncharacterized protein LOC114270253 [Camellia sinensis]|uniref:uncharacterized protein LOC114270253 n=1 Tax=Camellia sinensis TaxID=4442 RepID=UPI0010356487|nr:uncharacterized protein LOC114270253 [Camellia sinensis]
MVKAGYQYITVLGVDFMSENVRAILDQAGFLEIGGESLRIYLPFKGMVWFCEFKSLKAIEASMELMSASMELMSIRPFQIEGKAPFILHVEKEKNSVLLLILIEEPS